MERQRLLTAAGLLALLASIGVVARSARSLRPDGAPVRAPAGALTGRLGGVIASFDDRYRRVSDREPAPSTPGSRLYRVTYEASEGKVIAEVQPDGRVRQLTVSRVRTVEDTWEPEEGDWTVVQAQRIAHRWLPEDAALRESGTFAFQERQAGLRETYTSGALAQAFSGGIGTDAAPRGFPQGTCIASYYQTRDGGVAFLLIGPP